MEGAMDLITPDRVSTVVAVSLVLFGILHMLPGPPLAMQVKMLGIPAWFIACAGMLMFCSGLLFFAVKPWGLAAVGLCMGGALATAAKIPEPLHRPGGCIFSSLTLAAAVWANWPLEPALAVAVGAACLAGMAGRVLAPEALPKFLPQILLLDKLCMKGDCGKKADAGEKKKAEEGAKKEPDEGEGNGEAGKEGEKAGSTTRRPRASSPAPVAPAQG